MTRSKASKTRRQRKRISRRAFLAGAAAPGGVGALRGGLRDPSHAILNPAKLARGMKRVIEGLGVKLYERVLRLFGSNPVR